MQYHHELIAAPAGHGIAGTHTGAQARADLFEQTVTPLMAQAVVDGFEVVQVQQQQSALRALAHAQARDLLNAIVQQTPVGQAGEFVVERQALNLPFSPFALGDVARHAPVATKAALGIKHRLATDGYPLHRAVGVGALHFKVVKNFMRRQLGAVRGPLRLAHASVGQLPAALAKNVVIVHAEAVVAPAIETHETKLRVLLPVPVRGQMREAAPARLVLAQCVLQRDVLGDIGKGAHVATVFQHVCAYLQPAPRRRLAQVHLGQRHRRLARLQRAGLGQVGPPRTRDAR